MTRAKASNETGNRISGTAGDRTSNDPANTTAVGSADGAIDSAGNDSPPADHR